MKIWKFVCIIILLIVWYNSAKVFYYAIIGRGPCFTMDSHHRLMGWPGFIVQYRQDGTDDILRINDPASGEIIPDFIDRYAITDKYIVAKAKEGWLAINRVSLLAWGCYGTIEKLEAAVGDKFGELNIVDEFPRSNIYVPQSVWNMIIVISVVFLGLIAGVIFYPCR